MPWSSRRALGWLHKDWHAADRVGPESQSGGSPGLGWRSPGALAALAGAAVVVIGAALRLPSTAVTIAGAFLCFGLRFMAIRRGWHLPVAGEPEQPTTPGRAPEDRKGDDARRL